LKYNNHYIHITYITIEKIKIQACIILQSIVMTNMKQLFITKNIS